MSHPTARKRLLWLTAMGVHRMRGLLHCSSRRQPEVRPPTPKLLLFRLLLTHQL